MQQSPAKSWRWISCANWAATSTGTWGICTRRASKLCRARSRLHRIEVLRVICVWKLSPRSTRFTRFCTAQHSRILLNFVKLFRIFTILFSKVHWCYSKRFLKFTNFDEDCPESFQQYLRRRPRHLRFSNFLWFATKNCRIFQKFVFEKSEKSSNEVRS